MGLALCLGPARAQEAPGAAAVTTAPSGPGVAFRSDAADDTISVGEVAIALLATLGVGIAAILLLKKGWPSRWNALPGTGRRLHVAERLLLSPRCVLYLVEVEGRERFLIAHSGQSVAITPCAQAPVPDASHEPA